MRVQKKPAKKSAAEVGCFGRLGDEIPSELERDLWGRILKAERAFVFFYVVLRSSLKGYRNQAGKVRVSWEWFPEGKHRRIVRGPCFRFAFLRRSGATRFRLPFPHQPIEQQPLGKLSPKVRAIISTPTPVVKVSYSLSAQIIHSGG